MERTLQTRFKFDEYGVYILNVRGWLEYLIFLVFMYFFLGEWDLHCYRYCILFL